MSDPLDDHLRQLNPMCHRNSKKLLNEVREAYPIGVPALIAKSSTDRLGQAAGYSFHLGTPDEVLRRICSWLLTGANGNEQELRKLVPALWGRHGREDIALAALLMANLHDLTDDDSWLLLAEMVGNSEPAEALLLVIEEAGRATRSPVGDEMLLTWFGKQGTLAHLAILCAHAKWKTNTDAIPNEILGELTSVGLPTGDSLLRRVRDRLL
jgi:hypothetical protein